jgi:integrase
MKTIDKLNDRQISAWISKGSRFEGKSDGGGLWLCYRESMQRPVWRFRYTFNGKPKVLSMGSYDNLPLVEARKKAGDFRLLLTNKIDPAQHLKDQDNHIARMEREKTLTVQFWLDEYLNTTYKTAGNGSRSNPHRERKSWSHDLYIIKKYLDCDFGRMPLVDVKPSHVQAWINNAKSPAGIGLTITVLKRAFNSAVKLEHINSNPAAAFGKADVVGSSNHRDRVLSEQELIKLLANMDDRQDHQIIKLLLMLCVRKNELLAAKITDFDLSNGIWKLNENKTRQPIIIPLAPQAITIIESLTSQSTNCQLIPNRIASKQNWLDGRVINLALAKLLQTAEIDHCVVHDLRRTSRTILSQLKVLPFIAERCLNHTLGGMAGIYDHGDYFPERQEALFKLANHFEKLQSGDYSNVIQFRKQG